MRYFKNLKFLGNLKNINKRKTNYILKCYSAQIFNIEANLYNFLNEYIILKLDIVTTYKLKV